MDSLNELEIQNIRHICGMSSTLCDKIKYYKTLTEDTEVLKVFDEACNIATTLKDDLCNML